MTQQRHIAECLARGWAEYRRRLLECTTVRVTLWWSTALGTVAEMETDGEVFAALLNRTPRDFPELRRLLNLT